MLITINFNLPLFFYFPLSYPLGAKAPRWGAGASPLKPPLIEDGEQKPQAFPFFSSLFFFSLFLLFGIVVFLCFLVFLVGPFPALVVSSLLAPLPLSLALVCPWLGLAQSMPNQAVGLRA